NCMKSSVHFEGGFWVSDPAHPQFSEFKHLIFKKRYPLKQYVEKTKRSALVFNTPAVHNCHGWKLGQFLAMSKAIITTPFQNELPVAMRHGENVHFINNQEELEVALNTLLYDETYRNKLEEGAKSYYEMYAAPE